MAHATKGRGMIGRRRPATHRRVSRERSDGKDAVSRCGGVLATPPAPRERLACVRACVPPGDSERGVVAGGVARRQTHRLPRVLLRRRGCHPD